MIKIGKQTLIVLMICILLAQSVSAAGYLVPVGQVVGLELCSEQVTVAEFDEALGGQRIGLQIGDRITHIDSHSIQTVEDVKKALISSGDTVTIRYIRSGKEGSVRTQPSITSEGPRLGIYLKEGVTGVGTVTYYDPDSKTFGTLGHGVSITAGELVPMVSGNAYRASVMTVRKGQAGSPGQLMGAIDRSHPVGVLTKNTDQGIFGNADLPFAGTALPLADNDTVHPGSASILSTVRGEQVQEYSVEILKIYPKAKSTDRNMLIRVTDETLLRTTGGIVQGMSGSPILQDGRLVGAVTHVLVNDPTTGYGIFIENMLDAAA